MHCRWKLLLNVRAPYFEQSLTSHVDLKKLATLNQPRLETLVQIGEKISFVNALPEYSIDLYSHKKMKTTPENSLNILIAARQKMASLEDFTNDALYSALLEVAQEAEVKSGRVLWPVRIAITGTAVTPGGATEIAELLGKEETLARMDFSISKLERELQ